ncbi:MAG: glutaredoxin family protein [Rhodocyclaceae bacterium]|nr:glutaredoxin family protein [Rhodocyclaceae bacterium]
MILRHLALGLLLASQLALAQTTYRWVDKDGKVNFSDRPPPPSEQVKDARERELPALGPAAPIMSPAMRQAVADFPITLFVSSDCGNACNDALKLLNSRKLPFAQKSLQTPQEIEAFKTETGQGAPSVPTLMVGRRVLTGFQSNAWSEMLDLAGYPK